MEDENPSIQPTIWETTSTEQLPTSSTRVEEANSDLQPKNDLTSEKHFIMNPNQLDPISVALFQNTILSSSA